jgi:hypothetical protein
MQSWSGECGRPRTPVPVSKSGFDVTRFAPRFIARSPPAGGQRENHRVFRVVASFSAKHGFPRANTPPRRPDTKTSGVQGRSHDTRETWLPTRQHRHRRPCGRRPRDGGNRPSEVLGMGFPAALRTFTSALARRGSSSRTLRSDRARMRKARANTTLVTFDAFLPAPSSPPIQPVARLDGLSWDCPKIAPPSS